eukprot:3181290-Pyramimonas_sp.AAC.3
MRQHVKALQSTGLRVAYYLRFFFCSMLTTANMQHQHPLLLSTYRAPESTVKKAFDFNSTVD